MQIKKFTLNITRFRISLIVLLSLCIGQISLSQDLDKTITIEIEDETLKVFLNEFGEKSGLNFSYPSALKALKEKVSYKAREKQQRQILDDVLSPMEISYQVVEKQIVLSEAKTKSEKQKEKITVSGRVRDDESSEYIAGANVYTRDLNFGTITNAYGFYSLTLPAGNYIMHFTFLGYESRTISFSPLRDTVINIDLVESGLDISEVVIRAPEENLLRLNQLGGMKFSPKTLNSLPAFAGDVDVIKSLNTVPGITNYGDGSTLFYVRGGNSDQNLINIDDAPVFNPTHLFGFFTALAPDAIRDIEIYKGDFPATFGGRLSSVIDIHSKDGNMRNLGFGGKLGPFTSSFSMEGPFVKDRFSFFFSVRRSNLNWMGELAEVNRTFDFSFYDIHTKLNIKPNNKNQFFITFYKGQDDYSRIINTNNAFGISWDNSLASLRWNYTPGDKIFINNILFASEYNYYMYIDRENDDYWISAIKIQGLKSNMSYYFNPRSTLRFGIALKNYAMNPGNIHFSDPETQAAAPAIPEYNAFETNLYGSYELQLGKKFISRFGLRVSSWQDYGPTRVYHFDEFYRHTETEEIMGEDVYKTFVNPEPRISLTYLLGSSASLKAAYTRNVQYLQLLSNTTSPFTSLEVWVPAGPNIQARKADQVSVGYFRDIIAEKLQFSAEAYFKKIYNEIDYTEHASLLLNPLFEGELRFGDARAYGLEFLLRRKTGKLNGWIAYTWSRAFKTIADVNDGKEFHPFYDRPHNFNISLIWQPSFRWSMAANWYFISGGAITTPIGFYYSYGYQVPVYGKKNNDRLPDYRRLDLSVELHFGKERNEYQHSLELTLYNALGNKNPFAINFNKEINEQGDFVVPKDMDEPADLIPSTLSVSGMVPSINYRFRFK
ncbi:MAG: TonB-dependent receptor [Bacteroidales bacterium]|nr:TonB-dependent receptor [Bacteroidales bacterium]MCF8388841.1 TonB-dependent receptor [Bacteroidales bacterium]MCF8398456.1 TonB-dependent receptor [Bacteroidales bacterium]